MKTRMRPNRAARQAATASRQAEYHRLKQRRQTTYSLHDEDGLITDIETGQPLAKSERISLGIADLHSIAIPGVQYSLDEIANFCGCSESAIQLIEQKIIHTLRRRAHLHKDPVILDLLVALFEQRAPARPAGGKEILTLADL